VPPVMSAALVSLLVVVAGRRALLRFVPEVAVVPAEGVFSVVSGGGSAALAAVPRARTGISGVTVEISLVGGKVPETFAVAVFLGAERRHLTGELRYLLLNFSCVGVGATLASVGRGATSEMRSAQRAAASKLQFSLQARCACMLGGSLLAQMVRTKSSGASGARLLTCRRNWDGLRSPISSVSN
jgi:hypothetical protein